MICVLTSSSAKKSPVSSMVGNLPLGNIYLMITPNSGLSSLITDTVCNKQYCGSSIDILKRWANHKSSCNKKSPTVTGLSAHFSKGCPAYNAPSQPHLKITLIDGCPAPPPKAGHSKMKSCSCQFCKKFVDLENRWICRLGLLTPPNGLNSREDITPS